MKYDINTISEHWLYEYTGMNFSEIENLDYFTYRYLLRDCIIWKLQQTEEGRKHLDKCWKNEHRAESARAMMLAMSGGNIGGENTAHG